MKLLSFVMLAVAVAGLFVWFVRLARVGIEETARGDRPPWGDPRLWLAAALPLLLVGLVLAPKIFGGAIVFLPFLWIVRPRAGSRRSPDGGGSST